MLDRRRALQIGLAAAGALPASVCRAQQRKAAATVRYSEVVRSILFTPAYVALSKGFFRDVGLDVPLATAQGGDKVVASLLSGSADIILNGPEGAIYVQNSESPTKMRIFCGLITTDGFVLVGREKPDRFEWQQLKGRQILALRPGSTPDLYLEAALRQYGIDPLKDVELVNNIGIPARVGAWLTGQHDYAIFIEPDASRLELDGKAHVLASPGQTVGVAEGTAFAATEAYIRNNPDIIQSWTDAICRAQKWTAAAPISEIVQVLASYFPGLDVQVLSAAAERYRRLKLWKSTPVIEPRAIEKFQDILVEGNVLAPTKRVKFGDVVLAQFASKAR
jgi:NitT/TauT family transport system substrate-binding protein